MKKKKIVVRSKIMDTLPGVNIWIEENFFDDRIGERFKDFRL
jgi:hypothetical protein